MKEANIPLSDFRNDQTLVKVLALYSIRPTEIRLQVLKGLLRLNASEFTGGAVLSQVRIVHTEFKYHTLFAVLTVFVRRGLLAISPLHIKKPGRPVLVFTFTPTARCCLNSIQ